MIEVIVTLLWVGVLAWLIWFLMVPNRPAAYLYNRIMEVVNEFRPDRN